MYIKSKWWKVSLDDEIELCQLCRDVFVKLCISGANANPSAFRGVIQDFGPYSAILIIN